ncbi:hypothetical protein GCM10020358_08470 [Amorphoplanes nipponensis]|uniref:NB-ARC domain-containing protein n=1 Tax=Actinoplanes nipponensis TaxID=135950 RepID=UPI0031F18156
MRDQLRHLHQSAGSPTKTELKRYADIAGHSVGRSALAAVTAEGAGMPRWATVAAFVDACARHAEKRRRPLPDAEVDLAVWRIRHDQATSSGQRESGAPRAVVVGVVPALADCFQLRALADDLARATDAGGATPGPPASTWLLSGLGGVGKTQLAADLAGRRRRAGDLDLLVWISGTSRPAITAGYAQAAADLALPGADGSDSDRDAARFHAWLSTTDRRWLIVLDDLGTAADLKGFWPPIRPTGRTVVTTRLRGSALRGPGRHLVPVDGFSPDETVAYLRSRLEGHPELADDVRGLAGALHHLPLALAHATAYLLDEDIPCSEYRLRLAERGPPARRARPVRR